MGGFQWIVFSGGKKFSSMAFSCILRGISAYGYQTDKAFYTTRGPGVYAPYFRGLRHFRIS